MSASNNVERSYLDALMSADLRDDLQVKTFFEEQMRQAGITEGSQAYRACSSHTTIRIAQLREGVAMRKVNGNLERVTNYVSQ